MSIAEQQELLEEEDFVSTMLYKKELVDRQRLKWALTHTSWEKKHAFIEEYGDKDYKGNFTGQLKNAATRYMQQFKGEINNVGWYINAAYDSDVDMDTLKKLDALAQVITHDELQQLYHDLPDIRDYYVNKNSAHAEDQAQMWTLALEDVIEEYRTKIEEDDKSSRRHRLDKLNRILQEDEENNPW